MLQTNLREIDAAVLDVEATLDYLHSFGADAWLLSVGGILSNYPTGLASQVANPALAARASGDLVGDATAAAAERGVRVLARMDFSKVDAARAERHPEWCFVGPDGSWQTYNGLVSVCPSGDYYQREMPDVVAEVIERYPVSGLFVNWWTFNEIDYSRRYRGVCQCAACRRGFAEYAPGTDLPIDTASPAYDLWTRYAEQVLEDLGARLRALIEERAPHAAFIQGDTADIVFHEANNALGREMWHHRTADEVSAARTRRPDTPVLANSVAFVDMPYRLAGEDPDHFAQHLLQAIARGANPSTYVMGTVTDSPYECLDVAGEITRFHRDHPEAYIGQRPAAEVLLVRPDRASVGGARLGDALEEYRGVHEMLSRSQVPFDIVDARFVAEFDGAGGRPTLGDRRLVVLPGLGLLPDEAVETVDRFVAAGGLLVTTGSTGLSATVVQFAGSPVARVVATLSGVQELLSAHVRLSDDGWGDPVALVGELHLVDAGPGAVTGYPVVGRAPFGPPEKCHGNLDNGRSGRLLARVGAGGVLVVPWTIGRAYRATGAARLRRAFVVGVEAAAPAPVALSQDLPEDLEVVLAVADAGRVAHLLNRSGDRVGRFAAPVPLPVGEVRLPWPGATGVRALTTGASLPTRALEDGVAVDVPPLHRFEVLVETRGSG